MIKKIIFIFCILCLSINTTSLAKISNDEFIEFCEHGSYQNIKRMLDDGYDVNAKKNSPIHNYTPLHGAVKKNPDLNVIKLLIERGAFVNAKDMYEITPLETAIMYNRSPELIEYLLNQGADINTTKVNDHMFYPILHLTALHYHSSDKNKLIALLIKHGADVNTKNYSGEPVLFSEIHRLTPEIVTTLINAGADVNFVSKEGRTLLAVSLRAKYPEVIDILISRGAKLNKRNSRDETILQQSILPPTKEALAILAKHGYNFTNDELDRTLLKACEMKDSFLVQKLIDYGANPNVIGIFPYNKYFVKEPNKNYYIRQPLSAAILYGENIDIIKTLLNNGADTNIYTIDEKTGRIISTIPALDLAKERLNNILTVGELSTAAWSEDDKINYLKEIIKILEQYDKSN